MYRLTYTVTYMYFTCALYRAVHFGLRASFLLGEILKERGLYRELTQLFIKMTSEDADLRSAVCLEQAAHSFLRVQPSMVRKYALHLILAGHRYARAVQVRAREGGGGVREEGIVKGGVCGREREEEGGTNGML